VFIDLFIDLFDPKTSINLNFRVLLDPGTY